MGKEKAAKVIEVVSRTLTAGIRIRCKCSGTEIHTGDSTLINSCKGEIRPWATQQRLRAAFSMPIRLQYAYRIRRTHIC